MIVQVVLLSLPFIVYW